MQEAPQPAPSRPIVIPNSPIMHALMDASSSGKVDTVLEILDSAAFNQKQINTALACASQKGRAEVCDVLLDKGAQLTSAVISLAFTTKKKAVFLVFLKHGWNIDSTEHGHTALSSAVVDEELLKFFLDLGADPNIKPKRPRASFAPVRSVIEAASAYPSTSRLELLLSYGATLDSSCLVSAMKSTFGGGFPIMDFLINNGIDINGRDGSGITPLHHAVKLGRMDYIKYLLSYGADKKTINKFNLTPEDSARIAGRLDILELLQQEEPSA